MAKFPISTPCRLALASATLDGHRPCVRVKGVVVFRGEEEEEEEMAMAGGC